MKILGIGCNGLLGTYLTPALKANDGDGTLYPRVFIDTPTQKEYDITQPNLKKEGYDLIVHAAAFVDVSGAEIKKKECFTTNVLGTISLLKTYPELPFVYISTEYAHNPVNYYSETKLAAETAIKALAKNYLIIRTLFKPTPFPYVKAFSDQYTQGDYVDVIAPLIAREIVNWRYDNKTIYIGTGRKTIYELAKRTRPDVLPCSVDNITSVKLPKDYQ